MEDITLWDINNNREHEPYKYKEEQIGDIIKVTLEIELDTKWKSVQNYIEKCQGKQCLASKTIKNLNRSIKKD